MRKIKWLIFKIMYKKELEEMHNLRCYITTPGIKLPSNLEYHLGIKSGIEQILYKLSGEIY